MAQPNGPKIEDTYLRHNHRGRALVIVLTVFLVLAYVAVGVRLLHRRLLRKKLEFNDYSLIAGLVILTGEYGVQVAEAVHGLGLHALPLYLTKGMKPFIIIGKLGFVSNTLWNLNIICIKLSFLHLYLVLFGSVENFRRIVYVAMALVVIFGTSFILEGFLICKPFAYLWDKEIPGGKCGNGRLAYLIPGIISMALDMVIFTLPLPILWSLKMPLQKKVATSAVFGIGLGICLISAIRIKFIFDIDFNDFTYTIWHFAIFGPLEPMLGIVSACLPMLPPVIAKVTNGRMMAWAKKSRPGTGDKSSSSWPYYATRSIGSSSKRTSGYRRWEDTDYSLIDRPQAARIRAENTFEANDQLSGNQLRDAEDGRIRITTHMKIDSSPIGR